jgi:replicative DNA helicase
MDRRAQLLAEVQILGTLCNQNGSIEQLYELVRALDGYAFVEPEHEIVFGSIRSLLRRERLSNASLSVHLNNRGFPDVDLEKYCAAAMPNMDEALKLARRLRFLEQSSSAGAAVDDDRTRRVKHDI